MKHFQFLFRKDNYSMIFHPQSHLQTLAIVLKNSPGEIATDPIALSSATLSRISSLYPATNFFDLICFCKEVCTLHWHRIAMAV